VRNRAPILEVLARVLGEVKLAPGERPLLLEIASGSGEHALHFARALPAWDFQTSDPDGAARASIEAWRTDADAPKLAAPLDIDVQRGARALNWLQAQDRPRLRAIFCANMIHISPWEATLGLLALAQAALADEDPLLLYGPYLRSEVATAASNLAFDASLRERNASWGIRQLDEVAREGAARGMVLCDVVEMPANNVCVLFKRKHAKS